jgi:hypothetical protein
VVTSAAAAMACQINELMSDMVCTYAKPTMMTYTKSDGTVYRVCKTHLEKSLKDGLGKYSPQKAKEEGSVNLRKEQLRKEGGISDKLKEEIAVWLETDAAEIQVKVN